MEVIDLTTGKKIALLFILLFITSIGIVIFSITQLVNSGILQTLSDDVLRRIIGILVMFAIVFVLFFVALYISMSSIFRNDISKPLYEIVVLTKQMITGGDLHHIEENKSNIEIAVLIKIFNSLINMMIASKKSLIQALEESEQIKIMMTDSLSALIEMRDKKIGQHNKRTQEYVKLIARQLRDNGKYNDILTDNYIGLLCCCVPLHDIGKISIPDSILHKPGKLTDEEFEIMKRHTLIGCEALSFPDQRLSSNEFIKISREIACYHHERWDGTGYPDGLKGKKIPLCARIMALADVYDALVTDRIYKSKFSCIEAKSEIVRFAGSQFDPDIVEAFIGVEEKLIEISQHYQ